MALVHRSTFDLENIRRLCAALGDPQDRFRTIHAAGTKGKGSTCAYLAAGLAASGLKVGLYLSPHVEDLRERIQVDGKRISKRDFARGMAVIVRWIDGLSPGNDRPTFFEILTALAFLHFARERVDWAVIETGLGGRLDATNILRPELTVLTRIGLDHQQVLGRTVGAIAREKAGILKAGVPCVSAAQPAPAARVIRARARALKAPILSTQYSVLSTSCRLSMPGAHQRENAALALAGLDNLASRGLIRLDPRKVLRAIGRTALPGRAQFIPGRPAILVDGAHNPDSVRALVQVLREEVAYERLVLVFACQRDKDARAMLRLLLPMADHAIFTRVDNPRAAEPQALAELARRMTRDRRQETGDTTETAAHAHRALARARKLASPRDLVCVVGSLYLAGEALKALDVGIS